MKVRPLICCLLGLASAVANAETLTIVQVSKLDSVAMGELVERSGADFSVEMGSLLVLGGALDPSAWGDLPVSQIMDVDKERLLVHKRGCGGSGAGIEGRVIASDGNQALIEAPKRFVPYAPPGGEFRTLKAHNVVLRDLSGDARKATASDPVVQAAVDAVDASRWFSRLSTLASFDRSSFNDLGSTAARDWLAGQFNALGYTVATPSFTVVFSPSNATRQNVLATRVGSQYPNQWIVVIGHYDSRNRNIQSPSPAPGAEDNASGCSGVVELADVMSTRNLVRSVLFVCVSGEEQGLQGGGDVAQTMMNDGRLANTRLVINLDMIGYSADNDFDVVIETEPEFETILSQFALAAATYVPDLRVVQDLMPCCSDHMPFLARGAPGMLSIQGDFAQYGAHYHNTTDIPSNITNAQQLGPRILRMNAAVLAQHLLDRAPSDVLLTNGFE